MKQMAIDKDETFSVPKTVSEYFTHALSVYNRSKTKDTMNVYLKKKGEKKTAKKKTSPEKLLSDFFLEPMKGDKVKEKEIFLYSSSDSGEEEEISEERNKEPLEDKRRQLELDKKFCETFQFQNKDGKYICSLCYWTGDSGFEFLTHFQSKEHRCRLKERFTETQVTKPVLPSGSLKKRKKRSKSKAANEKTNDLQQITTKTEKKLQKIKLVVPESEMNQKTVEIPSRIRVSKPGESYPNINSIKLKKSKKMHSSNQNKTMPLLLVLDCIQIDSERNMKCIVCDKCISFSTDSDKCMKNISTHVLSRKHQNKLTATKNTNEKDKESFPKNSKCRNK